MPELNSSWPWISLAALGAFHGLNPAMGWLFAVALGLQERRSRAMVAALGAIALGHALAVVLAAIAMVVLGIVLPQMPLLLLSGVLLLGFAAYKVATRFRHPRWVGMRVGPPELILWSFLMATAHGAGLMLVPVLAHLQDGNVAVAVAASGHVVHLAHAAEPSRGSDELGAALAAVGVHTAAMFLVMGTIAVLVSRRLGVEVLRRAWINLDLVWVGSLVVAGVVTLGLGLWPSLAG